MKLAAYVYKKNRSEWVGDVVVDKRSDRLPQVISADADDNVLVFWSSHGSPGSMDFGGSKSMTYDRMRTILTATPHRKLLIAIDSNPAISLRDLYYTLAARTSRSITLQTTAASIATPCPSF